METVFAERKTNVLTPSTLQCLSRAATINVSLGCAHSCVYCYGKTYRCYPGDGKVIVFSNLLEKARKELPRKRTRPTCAYFCPSCDPFQPRPEVLDTSYGLMEFLLAEGVDIAFLTKARVTEKFLRLFERYPGRVNGQVGLVSLDDRFLRVMEPMAAAPRERLAGMAGVRVHRLRAHFDGHFHCVLESEGPGKVSSLRCAVPAPNSADGIPLRG